MKTLLIVDDNPDMRSLVRLTFSFKDFKVLEAENGMRGLEIASRERPQVILLDVMMPGEIDGFEVCRRIKADPELARAVVIMLTARAQKTDLETGFGAGADYYLTKPFSPLQLESVVREMLKKAE